MFLRPADVKSKLHNCAVCNVHGIPEDKINDHLRSKSHKYMQMFFDNGLWPKCDDALNNPTQIFKFLDIDGTIMCMFCCMNFVDGVALLKHQHQPEHLKLVVDRKLEDKIPVLFACDVCEVALRGHAAYFQHTTCDEHKNKMFAQTAKRSEQFLRVQSANILSFQNSQSSGDINDLINDLLGNSKQSFASKRPRLNYSDPDVKELLNKLKIYLNGLLENNNKSNAIVAGLLRSEIDFSGLDSAPNLRQILLHQIAQECKNRRVNRRSFEEMALNHVKGLLDLTADDMSKKPEVFKIPRLAEENLAKKFNTAKSSELELKTLSGVVKKPVEIVDLEATGVELSTAKTNQSNVIPDMWKRLPKSTYTNAAIAIPASNNFQNSNISMTMATIMRPTGAEVKTCNTGIDFFGRPILKTNADKPNFSAASACSVNNSHLSLNFAVLPGTKPVPTIGASAPNMTHLTKRSRPNQQFLTTAENYSAISTVDSQLAAKASIISSIISTASILNRPSQQPPSQSIAAPPVFGPIHVLANALSGPVPFVSVPIQSSITGVTLELGSGNWTCPTCNNLNYGLRKKCRTCKCKNSKLGAKLPTRTIVKKPILLLNSPANVLAHYLQTRIIDFFGEEIYRNFCHAYKGFESDIKKVLARTWNKTTVLLRDLHMKRFVEFLKNKSLPDQHIGALLIVLDMALDRIVRGISKPQTKKFPFPEGGKAKIMLSKMDTDVEGKDVEDKGWSFQPPKIYYEMKNLVKRICSFLKIVQYPVKCKYANDSFEM